MTLDWKGRRDDMLWQIVPNCRCDLKERAISEDKVGADLLQ